MKHWIRRTVARLILFTPIGGIEAVTTLHWWAIRRYPRFWQGV